MNLNNASVTSRVVPIGQIYPQNTLPINGPDSRMMAAGIKESKTTFALMALMRTRIGSICKKRSRFTIEIPEMDASVNNSKKRTRQKV